MDDAGGGELADRWVLNSLTSAGNTAVCVCAVCTRGGAVVGSIPHLVSTQFASDTPILTPSTTDNRPSSSDQALLLSPAQDPGSRPYSGQSC